MEVGITIMLPKDKAGLNRYKHALYVCGTFPRISHFKATVFNLVISSTSKLQIVVTKLGLSQDLKPASRDGWKS